MEHSGTTQGLAEVGGYTAMSAELEIIQDVVDVTTLGATKPDPAWEYRDHAGHFHAFTKDGKLPTLRSMLKEHVPCHDMGECGCGGYDVRALYCAACNQEVTPEYLPDLDRRYLPGRRHWVVTVTGLALAMGTLTTVRFRSGFSTLVSSGRQRHFFGIVRVTDVNLSSDGPSRMRLDGAGELGER